MNIKSITNFLIIVYFKFQKSMFMNEVISIKIRKSIIGGAIFITLFGSAMFLDLQIKQADEEKIVAETISTVFQKEPFQPREYIRIVKNR